MRKSVQEMFTVWILRLNSKPSESSVSPKSEFINFAAMSPFPRRPLEPSLLFFWKITTVFFPPSSNVSYATKKTAEFLSNKMKWLPLKIRGQTIHKSRNNIRFRNKEPNFNETVFKKAILNSLEIAHFRVVTWGPQKETCRSCAQWLVWGSLNFRNNFSQGWFQHFTLLRSLFWMLSSWGQSSL